jgi:hypothetical protein
MRPAWARKAEVAIPIERTKSFASFAMMRSPCRYLLEFSEPDPHALPIAVFRRWMLLL